MIKLLQRFIDSELLRKIKKSDIFETLKHSANYFSAQIAIKAIGLISIPIFTRLLTQEEYGILAIFVAYVGIFKIILSLNLYASVGRYYYEKKNDFGDFVGTTLIFVGLIFAITSFVFVLIYGQIGSVMQLPGSLHLYLIFASLFAIVSGIYTQIIVAQKKSKEMAKISIVRNYAGLGIGVLLIYLLKENRYLGKIWATLLVGFIFSIYFMIKMSKYLKFSFRKKHITYIVIYSLPLLPSQLSSIILSQFDRIMVNNITDAASAGLYSLGYNVGMLLLLVIGSTQSAVVPDFFKFLNNKEYDRLDALIKRLFSIITFAALGLILFAREVGFILADEKFHAGLSIVPAVIIGYLFYGMFTIYNRYISYKKKTFYLSISLLTAGALNIILNALFIPIYGYVSAAYTTVVSYFIEFLLTWVIVKMIWKQRLTPLWLIWKPTVIMFCFTGIVYGLDSVIVNAVLFFFIKLIALALFAIIVFWKEILIVYSGMSKS